MAASVESCAGVFKSLFPTQIADKSQDAIVSKIDVEQRPNMAPRIRISDSSTESAPKFRLLKRNPNTNSDRQPVVNSQVEVKDRRPLKSLTQREAEYAEARMRIFGVAESKPKSGQPRINTGICFRRKTHTEHSWIRIPQQKEKQPKYILRAVTRFDRPISKATTCNR